MIVLPSDVGQRLDGLGTGEDEVELSQKGLPLTGKEADISLEAETADDGDGEIPKLIA